MENTTCPTSVLDSVSVPGLMMLLATLIAGGIILVICYAMNRRSRSRQDSQKTEECYEGRNEIRPASESLMLIPSSPPVSMQPREFGNKRAKNKKRREAHQERVHPWMMGTLKGHTGLVSDMDFSSNGRYLASCADDESLRETRKHIQSSGQYHMYKKKESKKKTSSSLQADCKESQCSPRREDKESGKASRSRNRFQHVNVSEEPSSHEVFTSDTSSNDDVPDENQQLLLPFLSNIPAYLAPSISEYTLSPKELFEHGYPIESVFCPGYVVIKSVPYPSGPKIESDSGQYSNSSSSDNSEQESSSDNEKNFYNGNSPDIQKNHDKNSAENGERCDSDSSSDNEKSSDDKKSCDSESSSDNEKSRKSSENEDSYDSGSHSGSENSPCGKRCSEHEKSCDREGSSNKESSDDESSFDIEKSLDRDESGIDGNTGFLERTCARCRKIFYTDQNGEYMHVERCVYHCGKLFHRAIDNSWYHTCCNGSRFSRGCAEWNTHVWTGLVPGINGPFADYVHTVPSPVFQHDNNYGIYAMDCEMCFTLHGLELARVTVVDLYGQVVYDTLVKPSSEIIDYNTKFSGITEELMLNVTKTLSEVQHDLLNFIYAETILMGHGLGNDLRALRMIHKNVVDTSVLYPHHFGLPYRNGLKSIARRVLNRRIQEETHNSIEDAFVVVDLVLQKAHDDWQRLLSGR
ncbi:uncharacterized protein LOC113002627 isoform X2 [Solenopsis invicta]|uniref:uncharacterized protein LOC113002627 isoform X2 n=1 Tax=Solenopsis invicta TaxID=13686 RepID=UPI0005962F61|nr:uncharacterized protein LOC113002627 isoform X2 [Solenopsis invicta]